MQHAPLRRRRWAVVDSCGSLLVLTAREVGKTRRIAALRMHVERAIGRIKSYCIISNVIPLSLADIGFDIFRVCALLTNFSPPIVQ